MSKVCYVCAKKPVRGGHIARRGMARRKGGAGQKITGRSRRSFSPNVQLIRIVTATGQVSRENVCTKCIKAGKVKKA